MTTIAVKDGIMVGDGRCSLGSTVIKDDMVKVFWINNHLMGGAGRARSISTFAQWLQKHTDYTIVNQEVGDLVDLIPPVLQDDEEFTALVLTPDKQVLMYDGNVALNLGHDVPASIGSGSVFALAAMDAGASAEDAVKIAMKRDVYSGGEITVVQLEEESEPLTREVAENLSKEELINAMFGEQEEVEQVVTKEDFVSAKDFGAVGDNDNLTHIYSWTNTIVLWQERYTQEYLFEVDNIEYDINDDFTPAYFVVDSGFSTEEIRSLCNDMGIQYSLSNTREQLSSKIIKEIKSKITK